MVPNAPGQHWSPAQKAVHSAPKQHGIKSPTSHSRFTVVAVVVVKLAVSIAFDVVMLTLVPFGILLVVARVVQSLVFFRVQAAKCGTEADGHVTDPSTPGQHWSPAHMASQLPSGQQGTASPTLHNSVVAGASM